MIYPGTHLTAKIMFVSLCSFEPLGKILLLVDCIELISGITEIVRVINTTSSAYLWRVNIISKPI